MLQSLKRVMQSGATFSLLVGLLAPAPTAAVRVPSADKATLVLAGGCFWGVEAVYRHVKGVKSAVSGFAVPEATDGAKPAYAEAVRIEYDPATVSYDQLMDIFFRVAHDPTQVGRQGPDVGAEYRSVIFIKSDAEQGQASQTLEKYKTTGGFAKPISTEISRLKSFKVAEEPHQDYVAKNPRAPYVVVNDLPKLEHLKRDFPDLFKK